MKKNRLLILVTLCLVGCSNPKDHPTFISHLEKASLDGQPVGRKFANIDADVCLKSTFSISLVKSEIHELERKYKSGTKVKGKWKHLNLEDLPIPQANFLTTFGKRLGDLNNLDAIDYSLCKDLPCVINKIYAKEDYIAGYVHYLWYLKMGNYLTAHNTVYGGSYRDILPGIYNGKVLKVSDYLWSEDELYAFWRLLHMMKAPHTNLTDLTEIQRVPHGEEFGFVDGLVCGLAWSNGIVSLQDGCLGIGSETYPGTFYESVLHELTHQVDYHEGRKLSKSYRSNEKDYLDISKFFLKEFKDEAGKTIRQWEHLPDIKLVTGYAGTSPAENFAETIAYFRVDGSQTKKSLSPEHWDFTSKNYFSDKAFQKTDLMKEWIVTNTSSISQLAFKAVGNCTKDGQGVASTYFKKTDFISPLLPSVINCLGAKAVEISKEIQSKIKSSDPDGCKLLTSYATATDWEPGFKAEINLLMNKYLKELALDKEYFAKVQAFYDELPNRTIANNAFLSCAEVESEYGCYEQEVIKMALEKIAHLNLPPSHAQDLAALYFTNHPIANTKEYLVGYYRTFVSSHKSQITLIANEAWDKCDAIPASDEAPPRGRDFSVGDGYMVSSLFNCLNTNFNETANLIVQSLAVGNIKVQHPKEEQMLRLEVVPELQKSLMVIYNSKKEVEKKRITSYIDKDLGELRKKMLSDFVWVKDVLNTDGLKKDCKKLALVKIDFGPIYQMKNQVFEGLLEDTCKDIHTAPQYNTWLEESKSVFADKSIAGLEKRIVEFAQTKAQGCLAQYPISTSLSRIKFKTEREACLLGDWSKIEASAIQEFESDPLVIKFKVDITAVKSQLEVNRRRLQLRVIKEKF